MDNRKNNLPIEHRFMIIPFVEFHNSLFSNYPVAIVPLSHLNPMAGNFVAEIKNTMYDSDIRVSKYDGRVSNMTAHSRQTDMINMVTINGRKL